MDLCRGINDFNQGYQPKTTIVEDVKGDLVADSYSIAARWTNYFSWLLNVHGVINVRHREIYTAEILVPGPSTIEFELVIEKLICYKSPGID
jgi:hypothetical protein